MAPFIFVLKMSQGSLSIFGRETQIGCHVGFFQLSMSDLAQGDWIQECTVCMVERAAQQLPQSVQALAAAAYFASLTTSLPGKKSSLLGVSASIPRKEKENNFWQKVVNLKKKKAWKANLTVVAFAVTDVQW